MSASAGKRVRVLHTGGTLGMQGSPLEPGRFAETLGQRVPELSQLASIDVEIVANLDSSDLGPEHWAGLARAVESGRRAVDGFVVIHGTDTMAYTASALAYALRGLDRPVILTGAQRPLAALRTDARRNLVDAVEIATSGVCEVGICFDGLLLRGCRAVKSDARHYRAFETPGLEPLARLGVDLDLGAHIRRSAEPFSCDPRFDPRVMVLHVTPGFDPVLLDRLTDGTGLRGVVLVAFGVGTVPSAHGALAPAVERAIARGLDVVVVTSGSGIVDLGLYKNSLALRDAGAIPGGKMRVEAATVKLMHALAVYADRGERRKYLETDVAGERD
jgi:L-asparaginase